MANQLKVEQNWSEVRKGISTALEFKGVNKKLSTFIDFPHDLSKQFC